MNEIKIEKNVPLIVTRNRYPFKNMEVGDSIYVSPKKAGKSAGISFRRYIKYNKLDWKISEKTENDGVRIWRIL